MGEISLRSVTENKRSNVANHRNKTLQSSGTTKNNMRHKQRKIRGGNATANWTNYCIIFFKSHRTKVLNKGTRTLSSPLGNRKIQKLRIWNWIWSRLGSQGVSGCLERETQAQLPLRDSSEQTISSRLKFIQQGKLDSSSCPGIIWPFIVSCQTIFRQKPKILYFDFYSPFSQRPMIVG